MTTETIASVLRLGDEAPDFRAETTEGTIQFHEWIGQSWGGALLGDDEAREWPTPPRG